METEIILARCRRTEISKTIVCFAVDLILAGCRRGEVVEISESALTRGLCSSSFIDHLVVDTQKHVIKSLQ